MPGSNNGEDQQRNPHLYAQFMRATARDDAPALAGLIVQARAGGVLDDNLLRLGLQNCAKKGHEATARVLLEHGAKTDITPGGKGSPALFWAVSQPQSKGHQAVARLLLSPKETFSGCPADKNWRDDHGRSLVQSAAWRNHAEALQLLLDAGADVNARDLEKQTVLHSLAADKKGKWDCEPRHRVVGMLLDRPIDVNLRDDRYRTALHWACATGKTDFVDKLLSRKQYVKPFLNIRTDRGKTALNLACSVPPNPAMVKRLLEAGATPQTTSDGGWTCLHVSATIQNSVDIVELLLSHCPALLNAQTSTGLTALHCAAESGSEAVVRHLLGKPDIKLNAKDAFYTTPLLRAAQQGHLAIVDLLAPFNNLDRLSDYAAAACNGFEATIVDFRGAGSDHQNIVTKKSVFEVLYAKEKNGDHVVSTRVDKLRSRTRSNVTGSDRQSKPRFRWIHLPANNLAWVEALVAKAFIESNCGDLEGFKAVERSFSHQHRGPKFHSRFMSTLCQRAGRGGTSDKIPLYGALEDAIQNSSGKTRNDYQSSPERSGRTQLSKRNRLRTTDGDGEDRKPWEHSPVEVPSVHAQLSATGNLRVLSEEPENVPFTDLPNGEMKPDDQKGKSTVPEPTKKNKPDSKKKAKKASIQTQPGTDEEKTELSSGATRKNSRVNSMMAHSDGSGTTLRGGNKVPEVLNGSNIVLFMPYLHWETDDRRRRMREAIRNTELEGAIASTWRPLCDDETLIRAHLESSLHLRRTLDQFYLHGIDTEDRDNDQVVYRYCRDNNREEKVYMVDQLWCWIMGPGLIITAFPQRWQQPKNDPLNVLDGIIEDVNSKIGATVQSVQDLALLITARTCGCFDRHRPGDEDYQFLDMFESSIGHVNNEETALYREFYQASATVHGWLSTHKEPSSEADYPQVVDRFLDIGKETALLQEIKDIRDELNMITMVLNNQKSTLPSLCDAICEDMVETRSHAKARDVKRRVEEQKRTVELHLNEIDRMALLSRGIEDSLLNLLDLKQKQSNAFEARFARDQAAGTVRQGQIIMVFTMVTIIFLPMSFMAAFFTIPIEELPRSTQSGQPLLRVAYVSKYIFGIGLGMSVILIVLAFSINPLTAVSKRFGLPLHKKGTYYPESLDRPGSGVASATLSRTGRFSIETTRKSLEVQEMEIMSTARSRRSRSISIRRPVFHADLERG